MPDNRGQGQKWLRNTTRCAVYARDQFRCVYCDDRAAALTVDHADPVGGNGVDNLVTCCCSCNSSKGERSVDAWLLARAAAGEDEADLARVRQRVAIATLLPIDRRLGRTLEGRRGKGGGSFAALAPVFDELELEAANAAEEVCRG